MQLKLLSKCNIRIVFILLKGVATRSQNHKLFIDNYLIFLISDKDKAHTMNTLLIKLTAPLLSHYKFVINNSYKNRFSFEK